MPLLDGVPNNIRDLREVMDDAFRQEGFVQIRLHKGDQKVWALIDDEVVRFFAPHAQRRPWGYAFFGIFGIELPELRQWLDRYKPGPASGIFAGSFTAYFSSNEEVFREFMIEHGAPVPADLWVGLIKDRLSRVSTSVDDLVISYQNGGEDLGCFAHSNESDAWRFLEQWRKDPDPRMHVPCRSPTGLII